MLTIFIQATVAAKQKRVFLSAPLDRASRLVSDKINQLNPQNISLAQAGVYYGRRK